MERIKTVRRNVVPGLSIKDYHYQVIAKQLTRALHAGANARLCLHLENSKSKRGITLSKKIGGLPPLLVWVPLLIVNNCSQFQINIFSNNRDIRKYQSFPTTLTPPPLTTPGL